MLLAGVDYVRSDVTTRTLLEAGDQPGVVDSSLADTQDAIGVYAQDALTILRDLPIRGSSVVVTVAGRWDRVRHSIEDRLGGPSGGVHAFQRLNPRAGVNLVWGQVQAGVAGVHVDEHRRRADRVNG